MKILFYFGGKNTNQKLDLECQQYIICKRAIQLFFDEVGMFDHLTQEPPTNSTKTKWIVNNWRLLRLVCNSQMIKDNTIKTLALVEVLH